MPTKNSTTIDPRGGWNKGLPSCNRKDLSGQQRGILTIIKPTGLQSSNRSAIWECLCECGNICHFSSHRLKRSKHCGCLSHGLSRTRAYKAWLQAKHRCFNPKCSNYRIYGAAGRTICIGWLDVKNFFADMGNCPDGLTLERIDNDGNYSCGKCEQCVKEGWTMNCEWATLQKQAGNRSTNRPLTAFGRTETLAEWSRITGLPKSTIKNRVYRGKLTAEEIVTPIRSNAQG